jgi:hypothetical protein
VWQLSKARRCVRPWIAVVAVYALALQVLLSGLAAGHFMAAADASAGDLFAICHGAGTASPDDPQLPDKQPLPQAPCVLCTLTKAPSAILPGGHCAAIVDAIIVSSVVPNKDGPIIPFDSPTGQYQRGPPMSISIFG